ncbi:MAG: hypothetical protein WBL23_12105 [Salinisphaera sp.]|uniref:hypothetical protein n=1 Tax=Salinisphaera sp. TaxID=1914330 RepID=UPI003C7A8156
MSSLIVPPTVIRPALVLCGLFGAQAMIKIRELGDDVRVPKTPRQNRMQIFVFVFIPLVTLISGYAHLLQLWPLALTLLAGTTVGSRMMTGIYERPRAQRRNAQLGLALAATAVAELIYHLTRTGRMHFGTADIRAPFSFDLNWAGCRTRSRSRWSGSRVATSSRNP